MPYQRFSPAHYQKCMAALDEMEERDIIKNPSSQYASPLVLCWKKMASWDCAQTFAGLMLALSKMHTGCLIRQSSWPALGGNVVFRMLDLTSSYYNMPLHEDDKKYTAFSSHLGIHEYNCMSSHLYENDTHHFWWSESLLCYLNDVLLFGRTEQQNLERLDLVFKWLREHKLKLSPAKCKFLRRSVKFLGHMVSQEGDIH